MDFLSIAIVLNLCLIVLILSLIAVLLFLFVKENVNFRFTNPFAHTRDSLPTDSSVPLDQFSPDLNKKISIKFSTDEEGREITEEVTEKDNA